jgi:CubicO group peptidase (beta-lactamase class C family)
MTAALAGFVERREVPGVLAVVTDVDHTIYTGALGLAGRRSGMPMTGDTVFRIASMTKLVTSLAVMMLVDEQAVDLDAPLSKYLPAWRQPDVLTMFDHYSGEYRTRPAHKAVTVRELLSHTSGYGYWFLDRRLFELVEGEPDLLRPPFLIDEPGTRFNYGTSTDVLGQIIEPVTGKTLERFFAERIFKPLNMRDTSFELPINPDRLASVFTRTADGFSEQEMETTAPAPRGGGGLYSTAEDYCRLMRVFLNKGECRGKRLLSASACEAMTRNQIGDLYAQVQTTAFPERSNDFIFMNGTQKFGFGLAIESADQPGGRPAGTASWAGIFNTYFWIDFENEFAAVVLMQMRPFADVHCVEVCRRFERALYDCLNAS